MQVLFESRDPQAASLRDLAVHRLQLVLRRLRLLVSRARLRLSDINGPRGGVDKRVMIKATLPGVPPMVVGHDEPDIYVAIDRAAGRISRALSHKLRRTWRGRRGAFDRRAPNDTEDTNAPV